MSMNSEPDAGGRDPAAFERLSALADGELDSASARHACGHWQGDSDARSTWHVYHLIGDVLRSEDLACTSARDLAFLGALRVRLRAEPVVLAPQPIEQDEPAVAAVAAVAVRGRGGARRGRLAWIAPSALAAGFVAVAGVLVLNGLGGPPQIRPALEVAQTGTATGGVDVSSPLSSAIEADPPSVIADGQLIRSVRLDRYLAAHKQFAGSSALGVPSAFLRNATATGSER